MCQHSSHSIVIAIYPPGLFFPAVPMEIHAFDTEADLSCFVMESENKPQYVGTSLEIVATMGHNTA